MAFNLALLGLLTTALFAGCLSGPSPASDEQAAIAKAALPQNATAPASPPEADPAQTTPAEPAGCKDDSMNNYGSRAQIGDTYVISPYDGKVLVIYKETNGRRGVQTESMCPNNPDQKVAEVPSPVPAIAGKA
jgi:hypothetical protein